MESKYILVINPGSTSTKIAIFNNKEECFETSIFHGIDKLKEFNSVLDQYDFRKNTIIEAIKTKNFDLTKLSCIVSRGGLTKPVNSGAYLINEQMLLDLRKEILGAHASNLGPIIAYSLAQNLNIPSYIVDPVVVDELDDIARITGYKQFPRKSIFHALNHKAVARSVAQEMNKSYEQCNFIIAHLGGGITVGAHRNGRVIDVNNGFDGEGPFTPERTGTLPFGEVVEFCLQHPHLTKQDILKNFIGQGGLVSYFNTNNGMEIEKLILQGNQEAILVVGAMAYNIAKAIAALLVPLQGQCDSIILTGGLIKWQYLANQLQSRLSWLNYPIKIIAGEQEMTALANTAFKVLRKEVQAQVYR